MKQFWNKYKVFLRPLLVLFLVYAVALLPMWRANYSYEDDQWRIFHGRGEWGYFSRYISDFLAQAMGGTLGGLSDISPLMQIVAALIMSLSGIILVYVLCDKKVTVGKALLTVPLGLSPWFLQCMSYKFDAVFMALSVLASIAPFLLMKNRKKFMVGSMVGLLIMCMTYQASSGIYIVVAIFVALKDWLGINERERERERESWAGGRIFGGGRRSLYLFPAHF